MIKRYEDTIIRNRSNNIVILSAQTIIELCPKLLIRFTRYPLIDLGWKGGGGRIIICCGIHHHRTTMWSQAEDCSLCHSWGKTLSSVGFYRLMMMMTLVRFFRVFPINLSYLKPTQRFLRCVKLSYCCPVWRKGLCTWRRELTMNVSQDTKIMHHLGFMSWTHETCIAYGLTGLLVTMPHNIKWQRKPSGSREQVRQCLMTWR